MTIAPSTTYQVKWEKLPESFVLDDDPVDNIHQPALAAALTESLELANRLPVNALTLTNYGICATLNQQIVVKTPDWGYVAAVRVPRTEIYRSYTPNLQGDIPAIVMEFVSDEEGKEYSVKPTYPPGKWFFYEQILRVPNYVIFEPNTGILEAYRLDISGHYQLHQPNADDRIWIPELNLFLGTWQGSRENRMGYWLRWWDAEGELLSWGSELIANERQRAEAEHQRAEAERQRVERLAAQLRAAGIEPNTGLEIDSDRS